VCSFTVQKASDLKAVEWRGLNVGRATDCDPPPVAWQVSLPSRPLTPARVSIVLLRATIGVWRLGGGMWPTGEMRGEASCVRATKKELVPAQGTQSYMNSSSGTNRQQQSRDFYSCCNHFKLKAVINSCAGNGKGFIKLPSSSRGRTH
jgi:hypothetical protein